MAQFDVYRADGDALVLQYQSDILSHLRTRVVVPLLTVDGDPPTIRRLNPAFDVAGVRYHLFPQLIATFDMHELGICIATLEQERDVVIAAVAVLLSGV